MPEGFGGQYESRRDALKKLGLGAAGAAAVWSTPALLSIDAAAAATKLPPTFVASSTAVVPQGTNSVTVSAPAGIAVGDRLVALVITNPNTIDPVGQTPGGTWTQLGVETAQVTLGLNNVRGFLLTRVATVGDVGGSFQFDRTYTGTVVNAGVFRVVIVAYRGVGSISAAAGSDNGDNSQATHTFPSVPASADALVLRMAGGGWGLANGATSWATPSSPAVEVANTGNSERPGLAFHQWQASAGASGTTTATMAASRRAVTFSLALNP